MGAHGVRVHRLPVDLRPGSGRLQVAQEPSRSVFWSHRVANLVHKGVDPRQPHQAVVTGPSATLREGREAMGWLGGIGSGASSS